MATHLSRLASAKALDVVPLLKSISGTTFFGTFFDPPDRGDVEINIKLTPRRYFIKPGVDCELGPVDVLLLVVIHNPQ